MDSNSLITLMIGFGVVAVLGLVGLALGAGVIGTLLLIAAIGVAACGLKPIRRQVRAVSR